MESSNKKDLIPQESKHYLHTSIVHPLLREWNSVDMFKKSDLIWPIFVHGNDEDRKQEIKLLPDNYRIHFDDIVEVLKPLYEKGLRSIMLFGYVEEPQKDEVATVALNGPVNKALINIKKDLPNILINCDLCLCPYTSHGHCGVFLPNGEIDNDETLKILGEIALNLIKDGADVIAPSDCMD